MRGDVKQNNQRYKNVLADFKSSVNIHMGTVRKGMIFKLKPKGLGVFVYTGL